MIERIGESNKTESTIIFGEESAEGPENTFPPNRNVPPGTAKQGGLAMAELKLRISPMIKAEHTSLADSRSPPSPPNPLATKPLFEAPIPLSLEYFHALGIKPLLDDVAFLKKRLPMATLSRNSIIRSYIKTWRTAYQAEPVGYRRSNKARLAVNKWLRTLGA